MKKIDKRKKMIKKGKEKEKENGKDKPLGHQRIGTTH